MDFATFQREERRLALLRALQDAAQYRANALLLRRFCAAIGHTVDAERTEEDIAWLAEHKLVERTTPDGMTVATLTTRGLDVATGALTVPGVQRARPPI